MRGEWRSRGGGRTEVPYRVGKRKGEIMHFRQRVRFWPRLWRGVAKGNQRPLETAPMALAVSHHTLNTPLCTCISRLTFSQWSRPGKMAQLQFFVGPVPRA